MLYTGVHIGLRIAVRYAVTRYFCILKQQKLSHITYSYTLLLYSNITEVKSYNIQLHAIFAL